MTEAIQDLNSISLNGVRYKIAGPVQRSLVSNYPEKTVIGDYTKDSSPILSSLALSDHRGGIGLDVMEGQGDTDRSWYSTADIRYKGHLILPSLVTNADNLPAGQTLIRSLMFYKGDVYISSDATTNGIYALGNLTLLKAFDSRWGDPNWGIANIDGKSYLILGGTDRYLYYDGTTWTERVVGGTGGNMVAWDDRIWGIGPSNSYKLWYTLAIGSGETFLNQTPMTIPATQRGQLFVAKGVSGEEILFLALTDGLYNYDIDNDKWYLTGMRVPDTSTFWAQRYACGVSWRDDIYYGIRSSVYKVGLRGGQLVIDDIGFGVGLAPENGLPDTKGYIVAAMVAAEKDVIVSLVGNEADSKTSIIVAWNGRGWRVLYEGGATLDEQLLPLLVADILGNSNLVFANNTTSPYNVSYLQLSPGMFAPVSYPYAAAATHDWPWFNAGQAGVSKVAVRLKIETRNPTTSETVKVYYALNRSSTFQLMTNSTFTNGTITTAGLHTFDFPSVNSWVSTTARTGTEFREIQFRVVLANSTNTNTPDVLSLTLEYYKKLDPKYQFQVTLDLNDYYKGKTPKEQRAALLTAQETATLVEFTYRDPASNTDATFYVQVRPQTSSEQTGFDERGTSQLLLIET